MATLKTKAVISWELVPVLDLDIGNIHDWVHCHGINKNGHRCANPIGRPLHKAIENAIETLMSRPRNKLSVRDLEPLANSLLCKHQHRGKQDWECATRLWNLLQAFIAQGGRIKNEASSADLAIRLAAAEERANATLDMLQQATETLKNTQSKMLSQDLQIRKLVLEKKKLKDEIRIIKDERDVEIIDLRTQLETAFTLAAESFKKHDEEISGAGKRHEESKEKMKLEMRQQHDAELSELAKRHEEEQNNIQIEMTKMKESLRTKTNESQVQRGRIAALEREKHTQSIKITSLQENEKQTRIKELLRTIRLQLQIRMWQRHSEGLRADNETLMENQRQIQQLASGYGEELESLQNTLRPLKLDGVRKGLHTVFSVRPMRIRTLRISS